MLTETRLPAAPALSTVCIELHVMVPTGSAAYTRESTQAVSKHDMKSVCNDAEPSV
jgi:hypothetical protein